MEERINKFLGTYENRLIWKFNDDINGNRRFMYGKNDKLYETFFVELLSEHSYKHHYKNMGYTQALQIYCDQNQSSNLFVVLCDTVSIFYTQDVY